MSQYETIKLDASPGGVAVILLNRPDEGNALNAKMLEELTDALENLRSEEQLRMVLIRGAGEDFCIGADSHMYELSMGFTEDEIEEDAFAAAEVFRRIHDLPQLTVALAHGAVMGGGAGILAACDVAIAMEDAHFRFGEVSRGMIPAVIAPFIQQAIGPRMAKALFLTGESFDAGYAEQMGLVQYTVSSDQDMEEMLEYISTLAFANSPSAVADTKRLIREIEGHEINKGLSHMTAKRAAARWEKGQAQEGISAFLADRKPDWAK